MKKAVPLTKARVDAFLDEVDRTVEIPDGLAIGYALDELSPDEQIRLDELLAACPDARAELDALREAASARREKTGEARRASTTAQRWATTPTAPIEVAPPLLQRVANAMTWFGDTMLSPALGGVAFADNGQGRKGPIHWSIRSTDGGVRVRIASEHTELEGVRLNVSVERRVYLCVMTTRQWPDLVCAEFTVDFDDGDRLPENPAVAINVVAPDGPEPRRTTVSG